MADLNNTQQMKGLRLLCKHYKYNRQALADALSVDIAVVYNWFSRGKISAHKAIEAEEVTRGAVTKRMLRPDVKLWIDEE